MNEQLHNTDIQRSTHFLMLVMVEMIVGVFMMAVKLVKSTYVVYAKDKSNLVQKALFVR
jgi:hypothetical protein